MKKFSILFLLVFIWSCDPCRDVDCNHGTCVEGDCECDDGWTGSNCDVDMCASVNCVHGTCVAGVCQCDPNYEGVLCDQIIDPCLGVDCGDHGDCNQSTGECDCDDWWEGDFCDDPVTLCTNTCGPNQDGSWVNDGWCDDGCSGADYDVCDEGTDCDDCGPRTEAECAGGGGGDAAISVWTSIVSFPCNTQRIDVYIDDNYEGYIDSYYSSQPGCGDAGTVTVTVTPGTHEVYAECNDGDAYWGPGNINVGDGVCFLLELTEKKSFSGVVTKYRKK